MSVIKVICVKTQVHIYFYTKLGTMKILICKCTCKNAKMSLYSIKVLVAQLCPTLCNPMDYSPPGSSVLGIFQAEILEWVAISSFRGYSRPRDQPGSPILQADSLLPEPTECIIPFFNLVFFVQ